MPDDIDPLQADDAVERHMDELVSKAIEIRRERPGLRIVGLVAEADAPEAQALRETLPEASRDPKSSVAVVVTRESARNLLGDMIPGLLDWLEDKEGGPRRKLPVIHAARRGMRTTTIEYDLFE
jgi:hypothetical protein